MQWWVSTISLTQSPLMSWLFLSGPSPVPSSALTALWRVTQDSVIQDSDAREQLHGRSFDLRPLPGFCQREALRGGQGAGRKEARVFLPLSYSALDPCLQLLRPPRNTLRSGLGNIHSLMVRTVECLILCSSLAPVWGLAEMGGLTGGREKRKNNVGKVGWWVFQSCIQLLLVMPIWSSICFGQQHNHTERE